MSGSDEDDPTLRNIAEGEYHLIGLEQLKQDTKRSYEALVHSDTPIDQLD
jgi:hypothetical protein